MFFFHFDLQEHEGTYFGLSGGGNLLPTIGNVERPEPKGTFFDASDGRWPTSDVGGPPGTSRVPGKFAFLALHFLGPTIGIPAGSYVVTDVSQPIGERHSWYFTTKLWRRGTRTWDTIVPGVEGCYTGTPRLTVKK